MALRGRDPWRRPGSAEGAWPMAEGRGLVPPGRVPAEPLVRGPALLHPAQVPEIPNPAAARGVAAPRLGKRSQEAHDSVGPLGAGGDTSPRT